jgi:hypothetical protein
LIDSFAENIVNDSGHLYFMPLVLILFLKEEHYTCLFHTNWLIDADACIKKDSCFILIVEKKKCITDIHGADAQKPRKKCRKEKK